VLDQEPAKKCYFSTVGARVVNQIFGTEKIASGDFHPRQYQN